MNRRESIVNRAKQGGCDHDGTILRRPSFRSGCRTAFCPRGIKASSQEAPYTAARVIRKGASLMCKRGFIYISAERQKKSRPAAAARLSAVLCRTVANARTTSHPPIQKVHFSPEIRQILGGRGIGCPVQPTVSGASNPLSLLSLHRKRGAADQRKRFSKDHASSRIRSLIFKLPQI